MLHSPISVLFPWPFELFSLYLTTPYHPGVISFPVVESELSVKAGDAAGVFIVGRFE